MPAPFVLSSDLVSAYPAKSVTLADYIDTSLAAKSDLAMTQNAQTGTTYSFALADASKLLTTSNASPVSVTVTKQATVTWVTGTQLRIMNLGAGVTTLVADTGVTINGNVALKQYQGGTLIRTASDVWLLVPSASASASGLKFIDSASPSGASAVSFTSQFSGTYDNYRIIGRLTNTTLDALKYRMRTAVPADDSSANYSSQRITAAATTVNSTRATAATSAEIAVISTATGYFVIDIIAPNLAQPTALLAQSFESVTSPQLYHYMSAHNVSTAFPGISLFPAGGTMTGYIALYGYTLT